MSSVGKASVGLILIWACVLCLGQAARFYVHLVRMLSGLLVVDVVILPAQLLQIKQQNTLQHCPYEFSMTPIRTLR